jgi:peptidoglycan/LPS O-acetylase OafA/YrhL
MRLVESQRETSLDGLRGLACLMVLSHHLILSTSSGYKNFESYAESNTRYVGNLFNQIYYSPLHFLFDGHLAVLIFFVISGYVLQSAVNRNKPGTFLRKRIIRLYVPIIAAVIIAIILSWIKINKETSYLNLWLSNQTNSGKMYDLVANIFLLDNNTWIGSSLWSMKYEILFSFMVILFSGIKMKLNDKTLYLICITLIMISTYGSHADLKTLQYIPVFFIGTLISFLRKKVKYSQYLLIPGIVFATLTWTLLRFSIELPVYVEYFFSLNGAVLIFISCLNRDSFQSKFLKSRIMQEIGLISFSMYLIHAPAIVFLNKLFLVEPYPIWLLFFEIAIILIASKLFYNFIEKPTLEFVKSIS